MLAKHMQNLKLDLAAGQSVSIGEFRVTLVNTTDDSATFEIEGPGGQNSRQIVPMNQKSSGPSQPSTSVTA